MARAHVGHSLMLVVTLALAGCARDAPLGTPPPAPVLADVKPVDAVPTTEADPMPDAPAILSWVCVPVWAVHEDGSRRIACTTHGPYPPKGRFAGPAIAEHRGDPHEVCELTSMSRGAFTTPGASEILLTFAECKDAKGRATSSAVVLNQSEGSYAQLLFENDLRHERCERTRAPDEREIFYCEVTEALKGNGKSAVITTYFVVDFGHRATRHAGVVAKLTRHELDCAVPAARRGFVWSGTPSFHTEAGKLVIDVERSFAAPNPQLDADLAAECTKPTPDVRAVVGAAQRYSLTIEPRNGSYAAIPAS
jgi:hypothetical protein